MNDNEKFCYAYIKNIIYKNNGKRTYVVVPAGKYGEYISNVLEENHKEVIRVDNNRCFEENIVSVEELNSKKEVEDAIIIISCINEELKRELYFSLDDRFRESDKCKIYDIFDKKRKRYVDKKAPFGKTSFLYSIDTPYKLKLLDVGCGNNSAIYTKEICKGIEYVGLDIGDYNNTDVAKNSMDEYIVVAPDEFATKIESLRNSFDIVICSHNIEHCNEPERVVVAMADALKKGGRLYMSFPSEKSCELPSRGGCLNFYDDDTHCWLPHFDSIIEALKKSGMTIEYSSKSYRPFWGVVEGIKNEYKSRKNDYVLEGTWALYGFEAIIWAKKSADD